MGRGREVVVLEKKNSRGERMKAMLKELKIMDK